MASILIVDDHASNREFLVTLLGYSGHRLLEASDGAQALALARIERPDLIIADILMPTMDGYELVRQLRADPAIAHIPVIFCSAYYLEREAHALAQSCGVTAILTKPCEPQEVLETVAKLLGNGSTPASPPPQASDNFDRNHLRLLTDKLTQKVQALQTANEQLNALIELGLQLGSELDPQRLLDHFCQVARTIVGAKYAIVGVLDEDKPRLRYCFTSGGLDAETVADIAFSSPYQGVLNKLLIEGRPYRLRDLQGNPQSVGLSPPYPALHSFLGAPIVSPIRVYGWLCLTDKLGMEEFNAEDERLTGILAAQVGRVYENGRLYAELKRHALALEQEIAERRRIEESLRLSAKVFESNIEGIFITDADNRIISVNPAFAEITGYRLGEVIGKDPKLLSSGRHDRRFFQNMWAAVIEIGHWQGEIWNRRKNGETFPAWLIINTVKDEREAISHRIAIFSDITERKAAADRIHYLANHDFLTGLPNRVLLGDLLTQALAHAQRNQTMVALLFLDLDRFKTINDSLGHHVGDLLLQAVAERLKGCVRGGDTVARLGGDEFIIVIPDIKDIKHGAQVAEKIITSMSRAYMIARQELNITPSIGISVYPYDGKDIATLIRNADAAMYYAKESGRNNYQFFTQSMNASASERLALENSLRRALERQEFLLHYQPQLDINTAQIIGIEALIRWQHPQWGMVSPTKFIPVAEDSGLIIAIGAWVMAEACLQNRKWQDAGLPAIPVAVNLCALQFRQKNLQEIVSQALQQADLDPRYLELELTESILIQNVEVTTHSLQALKAMGLQLSIDDFGTGYSSLSYLKRFPIDKLKIDQSFVRDICTDPDDAAISSAIISMAHKLRLRVIAEGVETEAQLAFLKAKHCDEMQGYYFSRPLPPQALAILLRDYCFPPLPG